MEKKNSANAEGVFEPFPITDVPWEVHEPNKRFGMRYQHMSSFGGATQIGIANEILDPGKQANPAHYHMAEEEHVFVLEGELTCQLGDKRYIMSAGHYVCFPAGQKVGHALINHTDKPVRYLVIGNPQQLDVAVQTDSGRVAVKSLGVGLRESAVMDYWDGVDTGS